MFDGPGKAGEPPATLEEPAKVEEPVTGDAPALDEPATAVEVPEGGAPESVADKAAPAKPKRVSKPRKRARAKPKPDPEGPGFEANGRSDEGVTPPHGDPVASPREQGS
jgi:hypothetical protein